MKEIINRLKCLHGVHTGEEILFALNEINEVLKWRQIDELLNKGARVISRSDKLIDKLLLAGFRLPACYYLVVPCELLNLTE